jgi:hypothetical protein
MAGLLHSSTPIVSDVFALLYSMSGLWRMESYPLLAWLMLLDAWAR